MFFIALNILIPIKISTGPVAADGITRASGARNREIPKKILVKMTVSPVLPPASTPAEDSRYVVMLGIPNSAPRLVEIASTLKHLSIPGRLPSLSRYPAFAPTPRTVPKVEKKSGTNKAIRNGI